MIVKALILVLLPVAVFCSNLPPQPPSNTTTPAPAPNTTTTQKPDTTTTTTTLAPNTTTTTTLAPNTTTTTTTLAPNTTTTTTTLAPNTTTTTTTLAPNTTTTTTTTLAPNTTTTSPTPTPAPGPNTTTPTPSPTPVPQPQQGKWTVKDAASNVTCIIADMAIQVSVKYQTEENKTEVAVFDVPKDANATGTCYSKTMGNETQSLMLQWVHKQDKNFTSMLQMKFKKEEKDKKFVVQNITLHIAVNTDDFPKALKNISNIDLFHNGTLFGATLARSYKCTKQQEISLVGNHTNSTIGTIKISQVQLEAFHQTNSTDFGAIEDCERSTDIVPITVGCALVGLVAVVLIGYLVGRRRSQARGYLSM